MSFLAQSVDQFLSELAAKQPTPGGGAVAGVCGALAAALAQMVVSYSLGKKSLAPHQPMLEEAAKRLERARAMLLALADEDAQAYGLVNELSRLPDGDPRKAQELGPAQAASVQVPLAVGACAVDLLRLFVTLCGTSNPQLRSDLAIAAVLAEATARAARWNVLINAPSLADPHFKASSLAQAQGFAESACTLGASVERACLA
jgi:methenyltetrahydrofolate cyclohydrolase